MASSILLSDTKENSVKDLHLFLENVHDSENLLLMEQLVDTAGLSYESHVGDLLLLLPRRTGVKDLTARIYEMLSR